MKTVKSIAQATRAAAQSGGTLEVGGKLINSGGAKLSVVKPEPKPDPETAKPVTKPDPPDPVQPAVSPELIDAIGELRSINRTLSDAVVRSLTPTEPEPQQPTRKLVGIDVVRDVDSGLIQRLVPVYEEQWRTLQ